jgi:hypothetical protein
VAASAIAAITMRSGVIASKVLQWCSVECRGHGRVDLAVSSHAWGLEGAPSHDAARGNLRTKGQLWKSQEVSVTGSQGI